MSIDGPVRGYGTGPFSQLLQFGANGMIPCLCMMDLLL